MYKILYVIDNLEYGGGEKGFGGVCGNKVVRKTSIIL